MDFLSTFGGGGGGGGRGGRRGTAGRGGGRGGTFAGTVAGQMGRVRGANRMGVRGVRAAALNRGRIGPATARALNRNR